MASEIFEQNLVSLDNPKLIFQFGGIHKMHSHLEISTYDKTDENRVTLRFMRYPKAPGETKIYLDLLRQTRFELFRRRTRDSLEFIGNDNFEEHLKSAIDWLLGGDYPLNLVVES